MGRDEKGGRGEGGRSRDGNENGMGRGGRGGRKEAARRRKDWVGMGER